MKFPDYPRQGEAIRESYTELLNWCRANNVTGITGGRVQESPNGKTLILPTQEPETFNIPDPPFWPTLQRAGTPDAPTFEVTLSDGWISEVLPGTKEPPVSATACHKPYNILWGDEAAGKDKPEDRQRFEMAIDDQLSIVVYQASDGSFGGEKAPEKGPTKIVVEPEKTEGEKQKSVHYVPPGGDDQKGESGELHFKIAVLRDKDESHPEPWLETFLAGSNLWVYRDLPLIDNVGGSGSAGTGRVFQKYDPKSNKYKLRSITKGGGHLQVNENADAIEIRGSGYDSTLTFLQETDASPTEIASIPFFDGINYKPGNVSITLPKPLPAAWWGTIVFMYGDGSRQGTLTFENGRLMKVDYGDDRVEIEGTEASPGTHGIIVAAS